VKKLSAAVALKTSMPKPNDESNGHNHKKCFGNLQCVSLPAAGPIWSLMGESKRDWSSAEMRQKHSAAGETENLALSKEHIY
jgi:hypothetical protein